MPQSKLLSIPVVLGALLAGDAHAQCPEQSFPSLINSSSRKAEGDVLVLGRAAGMKDGDGWPDYVHVFRRSSGVWAHQQELAPWASTGYDCGLWAEYDMWGSTLDVAPAQDRIAVGAPWRDKHRGAVYTYVDAGGIWAEEQLVTWSGSFPGGCGVEGSELGRAVALDGDTLVAAAWNGGGTTLVFLRLLGGIWSLEDEVVVPGYPPYDHYGYDTLDLDGDRAVLGQPDQNAVSVFERTGASWSQTATVQPHGIHHDAYFGALVRLDADRFLAGAPGVFEGELEDGQAFVYALAGGAWKLEAAFASFTDEPGEMDGYGRWGDIDGDLAAVTHADGIDRYRLLPGGWQLQDRLTPFGNAELPGAGQTLGVSYWEVNAYTDGAATCALSTDTAAISVSAGGTQSMTLVQPAALAGAGYIVLGSLAGTAPGISAYGFTLPLNLDAYCLWTAGHPGAPPLAGTLGTFDSAGQASASFKLPPGLASSLVGLVAHHAYVAFDGSTGQPLATSNAAPLVFVP